MITGTCNAQSNGWINLFDGKTLNGWKRLAGTAEYSVENGMIVGNYSFKFRQYISGNRKRIWKFYPGAGYKN